MAASRPARLGAAVYYKSSTKRASAHTTSSAPHQTPLVYIASTLILRSMCLCLHHTVRWGQYSAVLCPWICVHSARCANPSSSHHQSRGEGKEETRGPTALVAEYVTRRRRPRDGGACTVPLTTATHTHVRARTAESRGGTPRQDPGNECAVRTTEPAGCSVPSPRRRSACTRARRQRYLAWPGHRRTLLPPWPRPRVPFWLALAPAQSSQSQASATTTTFSFRRPAPTLGKSEEQ
jgi:hypothetical protein